MPRAYQVVGGGGQQVSRKGLAKPIDFDGCLFNAENDAAQSANYDENEMRVRQIMNEMNNNPYGQGGAISDAEAEDAARQNQVVDLTHKMFVRPAAMAQQE